MPRGNMPDELFQEEMRKHHRVMDEFAESTHKVISNLVAKVKDLERDMDTTIGCEAALRERIERLEQYGNSCDNEIANLQKRVGKLDQKLAERESVEAGEG